MGVKQCIKQLNNQDAKLMSGPFGMCTHAQKVLLTVPGCTLAGRPLNLPRRLLLVAWPVDELLCIAGGQDLCGNRGRHQHRSCQRWWDTGRLSNASPPVLTGRAAEPAEAANALAPREGGSPIQ